MCIYNTRESIWCFDHGTINPYPDHPQDMECLRQNIYQAWFPLMLPELEVTNTGDHRKPQQLRVNTFVLCGFSPKPIQ